MDSPDLPVVDLLQTRKPFSKPFQNTLDCLKTFSEKPLMAEETYFLRVLEQYTRSKEGKISRPHYLTTSFECEDSVVASGVDAVTYQRIMSKVRAYRTGIHAGNPPFTLAELRAQLRYYVDVAFCDWFLALRPVYENWIRPIQIYIAYFEKIQKVGPEADPVIQGRIDQLQHLLEETKGIIQKEVQTWFDDPDRVNVEEESEESKKMQAEKQVSLFGKIIALKETYEKEEYKKGLGSHRQTGLIVKIVRTIWYFFLAAVFRERSYYYKGIGYTDTQVTLFGRTRAMQELKEKSETAIKASAPHLMQL